MGSDYGSLGNVIAYLNDGAKPLKERLEKSLQIFYIPLPVPAQHKEEVVISWLTGIISTNKALQYTDEELISVWETLNKVLTSRRLQALCKKNWVCSFSSSFIETLVTTSSSVTISAEIKRNVFSICDCLLSTPRLSPHIQKLVDKSLPLLISLLEWVVHETPSHNIVNLLNKVFQSTQNILETKYNKVAKFITIYDKMLYPLMLASLNFIQTNNETREANEFLLNNKNFIQRTVFSKDCLILYKSILELPLMKDCKMELTKEGVSFFQFLVKCVENNFVNTGTLIMREFLFSFFQSYKNENHINYKLIVNTVHLLGISLKGGPSIEKNSIAASNISQTLLDDASEGAHVAAVLQSILVCKLDILTAISHVSMKKWLEKLGEHIIDQNHLSQNSLKCLALILLISPTSMLEIQNLLPSVISIDKFSEPSYLAFDDLLCKMLEIHTKMRNIDVLFKSIASSFSNATEEQKFPSLPKPSFIYEGQELLSARFMSQLLSTVSSLGTQMVLNLGTTLQNVLVSCHSLLQSEGSNCRKNLITATLSVWLSARILSSFSLVDAMSISGMDKEIGKWMNKLAMNGILPLISDYLAMEKKDLPFCSVLLDIIFVWAEVHANLLSTDTGYRNATQFPPVDILKTDEVTDFSAQASFISKETWKLLIDDVKDDATSGFVILQLVIQKIAFIQIQIASHKAKNVKSEFQDHATTVASCLNYVFDAPFLAVSSECTNLIAYHLPSIISLLDEKNLRILSRHFMTGVQEEGEMWLKFGCSHYFKECAGLQNVIFSSICDKIHALITGGKRKLKDDCGSDSNGQKKVSTKYLSHKILLTLSSIRRKALNSEVIKQIGECYSFLESLLSTEKKHTRLASRSEGELLSILKVIGYFPLPVLKAKEYKSMFALLVIMLLEEGRLQGRHIIVSDILMKLNILACSVSFNKILKLFKKKAILLLWLTKESESYLGSSSVEVAQLIKIISKSLILPSQTLSPCIYGEHINFLKSSMKSFFDQNSNGKSILRYSKQLVASCKDVPNKEVYLQAALMQILLLNQNLKATVFSMNTFLQESVKIIGEWLFDLSKNVELSTVTPVTISTCLNSFSMCLLLHKKLNRPFSKRLRNIAEVASKTIETSKDADKPNGEIKTSSKLKNKVKKTIYLDIDWKILRSTGLKMASLCSDSENVLLQQQSLYFLITLLVCIPEFTDNLQWSLILKTWKAIAAEKDIQNELKPAITEMMTNVTLKNYNAVLENLTEGLENGGLNIAVLSQCLMVVSTVPQKDNYSQAKCKYMENLIGIIALQSEDINKSDEVALIVLHIFQAIFDSKSSLSLHWKSMVFGVCLNLQLKEADNQVFTKVFHDVCKLTHTLMLTEPILISNRVPTVLSIVSHLSLSFIAQSDQTLNLKRLEIKELESCGQHLEKVAKELHKYAFEFSKLCPFTIASIVEGLQQTILHPSLKVCVERVVFNLFDISDSYSLRHLLVSLPTSITTLLKHLHQTFEETFRYNPKVA